MTTALSVDLGSASGRIIAGTLTGSRVDEVEIHRFAHHASMVDGYLCWDLDFIRDEVVKGLLLAVERFPDAASVSVDTWGVDWVALDDDGERVTPGRTYRDERTTRTMQAFQERLPDERGWDLTGIAPATINSANQMFAFLQEEPALAASTRRVLFLPDYFTYLLSGVENYSPSHISTSGLCVPGAMAWCDEVFDALGIPRSWVGEPTPEQDVVGPCTVPGLEQLTVLRAGAHDTACAIQALQRAGEGDTYFLSSGSWSVLGVVRDEPLMSPEAQRIGMTNEATADGRMRPLFNITGLWMLQECQRDWASQGQTSDIVELVALARQADSLGLLIDPDEPGYALPGSMVQRITDALVTQGAPAEISQGQLVLAVLESLAARYAKGVADLSALTGDNPAQLSVVGGGSRNELLCDLTAKAVGVPVLAGPAEASTLGSLLAQFEIMGSADPTRRDEIIAATARTRWHRP